MIDDAEVQRVLADLDPAERAGGLRIIKAYADGGRALARVADAMVDPSAIVPPAAALQAQSNAELRVGFLSSDRPYTSEALARLVGSRAENAAQYASRFKRQGQIFSVKWGGRALYPRFQFSDEGRPKALIADVLRIFDGELSDWQTALWFVSANGFLDDRAPVDVMSDDPTALLDAAREEVGAVVE